MGTLTRLWTASIHTLVLILISTLQGSDAFFSNRQFPNSSGFHSHYRSTEFPCRIGEKTSSCGPTTVNSLRPQDIGMVGALGDSLTAGTGATATNLFEIVDENRGVSFATGGDGNWFSTPTVANIFREFNPYLRGSSYGKTTVGNIMLPLKTRSRGGDRGLNLSVSGAKALDLPTMAYTLVQMVKRLPNWDTDWKIFTVAIGHNDLCSHSCNTTMKRLGLSPQIDTSIPAYAYHVERALDILQQNLPRTIIYLVGMADVTMVLDIENKPPECVLTHYYECGCLFQFNFRFMRKKMKRMVKAYRNEMKRLSLLPKYNQDDFLVEYLPALEGDLPREMRDGRNILDLGLLAPDCFHFMKNLHGLVARNLWNNMIQPVGERTANYALQAPLVCPSTAHPFLSTKFNSSP